LPRPDLEAPQKRAASSNVPRLERSRGHASDLVTQAVSLSRAPGDLEIESAADHRDGDDVEQGPDDLERTSSRKTEIAPSGELICF